MLRAGKLVARTVETKIQEDLAGACDNFGDQIRKWVFVLNHTSGFYASLRVLGYSKWYEPASKEEIFEKLAMIGHEPELVAQNAQVLHDNGLIKITENYYLPLNEEICQQAAEFLMAEFLQELQG